MGENGDFGVDGESITVSCSEATDEVESLTTEGFVEPCASPTKIWIGYLTTILVQLKSAITRHHSIWDTIKSIGLSSSVKSCVCMRLTSN